MGRTVQAPEAGGTLFPCWERAAFEQVVAVNRVSAKNSLFSSYRFRGPGTNDQTRGGAC